MKRIVSIGNQNFADIREKLIILITHDMEMIKACDKILRI